MNQTVMCVAKTFHRVGLFKDIRNRCILRRQQISFVQNARKPTKNKTPTRHILKCNADITDGGDITEEVDAAENYADITSISMINQYFGFSVEDDDELPTMVTLEERINH